jgi:hypothetical protein
MHTILCTIVLMHAMHVSPSAIAACLLVNDGIIFNLL